MRYRVGVLAALLALGIGCRSARTTEPIAKPSPMDSRARAGEIVFMRECHACHPHGEAGVGPALNNKPFPDVAVKLQIRTGAVGAGTMPPFPPEEVSDQEMDQIIAYLSAIRKI